MHAGWEDACTCTSRVFHHHTFAVDMRPLYMECTGEFENIPRNHFTSRYVKMVLRSSFAGSLEFLDPGEAPYTDK